MLDNLEQQIGEKLAAGLIDPIAFGQEVAAHVAASLPRQVNGESRKFRISPSNYGSPCVRKLWQQARDVEGEPLLAAPRIKFMYGDLIEALALPLLAEVAEVSHVKRKYSAEIDGIPLSGEGDLVLDGYTADIKSMSKYAFNDWTDPSKPTDDKFGYIWQLSAYNVMRGIEDAVDTPDTGIIVAVAKELGHIKAVPVQLQSADNVAARLRQVHQQVDDGTPPERLASVPEGKSGNEKLCVACSYCEFKGQCFPEARAFLYSNGPVWLTKVVRQPNVPEMTNA